jgi:protein-S-isoprenylcysteine O-methyltransferase Ste14
VKLLFQTFFSCACIAALLLVSAGTYRWPEAWLLVLEIAIGSLVLGTYLARSNPDLLEQRLQSPLQPSQERLDRIAVVILFAAFVGWTALMGLDAMRFDWSHVPLGLKLLGAVGIGGCYAITLVAFRANSFAVPSVKIQRSREQQVATTGPYAVVRHPMYAAAALFIIGTSLLLGSWWGLACSPLLIGAFAFRAVNEERLLRRELMGYADYCNRVRYRMFPGFW